MSISPKSLKELARADNPGEKIPSSLVISISGFISYTVYFVQVYSPFLF